jgi:hypothetical protein
MSVTESEWEGATWPSQGLPYGTEQPVQQAIGEKLPGSVFSSHFLAKPGAGRAQLGVFGHSGAIEAIYFAF